MTLAALLPGFRSVVESFDIFLAVQDSSIGDLVSHSLTHSLTDVTFDFSDKI